MFKVTSKGIHHNNGGEDVKSYFSARCINDITKNFLYYDVKYASRFSDYDRKYLFGAVLQAHIRIKVLKNIPAKRYDFFVYLRVILDICER